ncbi:MAG TPA: hypothetical protein VK464_01720, partial [Symbiobacteriaceae bacterium]|nr:hypothetical protein [Symbiobacteriaceae bacterium]
MLTITPSWIDGTMRLPLYLNGRLLTADDLLLEQRTNAERTLRLAGALGVGVAGGLEVAAATGATGKLTAVTIVPGTGVVPGGGLLALGQAWTVSLADDPSATPSTGGKLADPDTTAQPPGIVAYVLVAAEHRSTEQQGQVPGFDRRALVVGMQLELLPLTLPSAEADDPTGARLRNRLAYAIFGTANASLYGALEQLMNQPLGRRLPLAVVAWSLESGAIAWVDRWSVRRRLQPAGTASMPWSRPPAVVEAIALQFQEQLTELQQAGSTSLGAEEVFAHLPPAGYLPPGYDAATFFHTFPEVLTPTIDPAFLTMYWEQRRLTDPMPVGADSPPVLLVQRTDGYLVFLRGRSRQQPAPQPVTGAIWLAITSPPDPSQVQAWATDDQGRKYDAVLDGTQLEIRDLLPGYYTVTVRPPQGYEPTSFVDKVGGGTVQTHTITPVPSTPPPPQPVPPSGPPLSTDELVFPGPGAWVGKLVITPQGLTAKASDLPAGTAQWTVMALPQAAQAWLNEWGTYLAAQHPTMPFDLSQAKVIYNSAQFPQTGQEPQALGVYGATEQGPWVPITCVSTAPSGGGLMADTTAPSASDGEQGGDQTSPDEGQATPDENQAVPDATAGTLPNLADTP